MNLKKSGFNLVEIMIVVAILGLLAAIAIPNLVNGKKICIYQLEQIRAAKATFALWSGKTNTYVVLPADIYGPGKINWEPTCPAGGKYTIGAINANPTCSIQEHALPNKHP